MKFFNVDVDKWVAQHNEYCADRLLDEQLPGMRKKLDALDRHIREVLEEIKKVFPNAEYYTASGGFNLLLGSSHDNNARPQEQRSAWGGFAQIGDGDW